MSSACTAVNNMIGSSLLTAQALITMKKLEGSIIFVNEYYNTGDVDDEGPTEVFWTLDIVIQKEDGTERTLRYSRELFYKHGCKNGDSLSTISYFLDHDSDGTHEDYQEDPDDYQEDPDDYQEDPDDYQDGYQNYQDDPENFIHNIKESQLCKQGKMVLEKLKGELGETDVISFIGEKESYDGYDKYGPTGYLFDLFIFVKKEDGSLKHHHFHRAYYSLQDDMDVDDVPYDQVDMSEFDFRNNIFKL